MHQEHQTKGRSFESHKRMPLMGQQVVVQCEGFRCLAYLDVEGKWRSAYDGKELPRVLEIIDSP